MMQVLRVIASFDAVFWSTLICSILDYLHSRDTATSLVGVFPYS